MSRPAPVSRPDPDRGAPGARAAASAPARADRVALVAVWVLPFVGAGALLLAPTTLAVLVLTTSPVLLLVAGAGWGVHTLVLRSRSWVRARHGRVPRADRVLAWTWGLAWAVPGVAAAALPEEAVAVVVVVLLLGCGMVPATTIVSVSRNARARRAVLDL